MDILKKVKVFNGLLLKCRHPSKHLGGLMADFQIFLPEYVINPATNDINDINLKAPAIYYLAGLTCTDDTGPMKCGGLGKANELKLVLVFPDTSPRGAKLPDEETDSDIGTGASFYINATAEPWNQYYNMYDYIVDELPTIVEKYFPVCHTNRSIMGHSMGGHGALIIGLRQPDLYQSISAFAPLCHPMNCQLGIKAYSCYFKQRSEWKNYDSIELLENSIKFGKKIPPILIDQGTTDEFLKDPDQLQLQVLKNLCSTHLLPITVRYQEGYDHSYFFVSSFFADHLLHHAKQLWSI